MSSLRSARSRTIEAMAALPVCIDPTNGHTGSPEVLVAKKFWSASWLSPVLPLHHTWHVHACIGKLLLSSSSSAAAAAAAAPAPKLACAPAYVHVASLRDTTHLSRASTMYCCSIFCSPTVRSFAPPVDSNKCTKSSSTTSPLRCVSISVKICLLFG